MHIDSDPVPIQCIDGKAILCAYQPQCHQRKQQTFWQPSSPKSFIGNPATPIYGARLNDTFFYQTLDSRSKQCGNDGSLSYVDNIDFDPVSALMQPLIIIKELKQLYYNRYGWVLLVKAIFSVLMEELYSVLIDSTPNVININNKSFGNRHSRSLLSGIQPLQSMVQY